MPSASDLQPFGASRDAGPADAIGGVCPRFVVEPASAEAMASLLGWASQERLSVLLRGGGTKLGWGQGPDRVDLLVSTSRLNRVLSHEHGDLTATAEAGASIAELNRVLGRHGQWLPIDTAFDASTIGGAIATNDSGPLRHRYGTTRDLLIGIQLATTDGRLVKAGGNVVKNVAGYDLGRLMSGSFGSFAAIVTATFKLSPLPLATATMAADYEDAAALARAVAAISGSQLEPAMFDVHLGAGSEKTRPTSGVGRVLVDPPTTLAIQFASTQAAIDAQVDQLRQHLGVTGRLITGDEERAIWRQQTRSVWDAPGAVIRLSWLPASLGAVLDLVARIGGASGIRAAELAGRAGVGAGFLRVHGDPAAQAHAIGVLREHTGTAGNIAVLRAEPLVKQSVDVSGPLEDRTTLIKAVKRAFDPQGILKGGNW